MRSSSGPEFSVHVVINHLSHDLFSAALNHGFKDYAAPLTQQWKTRARLLSVSPRLEMSNYPPPPPFGGPFNSTALFAQSVSANLPGLPQYSYGSLQNPPQHTGGALDAHYANTYYFNRNQQEVNNSLNTMTNAGVDELPNMAVAQPSVEPISHSSYPGSRETPHLTQHLPSASSNAQRSDPQHRLGLVNQIERAMPPETALPASAAAISDLEDGELSDDNGGEHSKVPSSDSTSHDRATVVPTELNSHGKLDDLSAVRHTATVKAPALHKGIHRWVSRQCLIFADPSLIYRKKAGHASRVTTILRPPRQ